MTTQNNVSLFSRQLPPRIEGLPNEHLRDLELGSADPTRVQVIIRRQVDGTNSVSHSGSRSTALKSQLWKGKTMDSNSVNVLGFYHVSYGENNKYKPLYCRYALSSGNIEQYPIQHSSQLGGAYETLQLTLSTEEVNKIEEAFYEDPQRGAFIIELEIPRPVLQGIFISPNGESKITPLIKECSLMKIYPWSAQFDSNNINVAPNHLDSSRAVEMATQAAHFQQQVRGNIAQERLQKRIQDSGSNQRTSYSTNQELMQTRNPFMNQVNSSSLGQGNIPYDQTVLGNAMNNLNPEEDLQDTDQQVDNSETEILTENENPEF